MGYPWTEMDDRSLLALREWGASSRECADLLGRTVKATRARLTGVHGLCFKYVHPWTAEQDAALRLAWVDQRKTSGQIARRINRSRSAVMGRVRSLGLLRKYQAAGPYDPAAKYRQPLQAAA